MSRLSIRNQFIGFALQEHLLDEAFDDGNEDVLDGLVAEKTDKSRPPTSPDYWRQL